MKPLFHKKMEIINLNIQNISFKSVKKYEDKYRNMEIYELVLKQFHEIDGVDNLLINENDEIYIKLEFIENKYQNPYIYVIKIVPGDEISCTNENALLNLNEKLCKLGYKTRIIRDIFNNLRIVILNQKEDK